MRIVDIGDVNGVGAGPVPNGNYVACALGPDSLVDTVRVDGRTLGPGSIVPVNGVPTITPIRGVRTGPGGAATVQVNTRCQLRLFEAGDAVPSVATARAPVRVNYDSAAVMSSLTSCLRLPWAGRRYASLHMTIAVGQTLTWQAYGVKYRPRGAGVTDPPWQFRMDSGTFISATDATTTELDCTVRLIGGSDSFEDYDELEVYFSNGAAYRVAAQLEGWG